MSLSSQSGGLDSSQDVSQQTLPKEVKKTHLLSYKRHRACMHVETDYLISDRGKDFLRTFEKLKDCDIPRDATSNTFIFDRLVRAASQTRPPGKIALWYNILRLQIAFLVSYPSKKEERTLTASEIHSSGLPIIVSDFIKKNNDTLGSHNVAIMPFKQNEDHVKIYLGDLSKGNRPRSQNSSSNSMTALATILRMKVSIRFVNCNQKHNNVFQKGVRDRFYTDLCSTTTAPMIKVLLERCMRLFLNTYIIKKFQTSLFKIETNEIHEPVPQIEQLVEAMTSITLENKQSERLQKAFTLLSDIVKAKEGAIPLFHNSDSTKSHAEHQSTRWVYQTALMRSDWKMRKKDLKDHIVALPGAKKSHHNTPHVLISENVKFPFKKAQKATTTTQSEDETMEEVLSQVPSQSSSQDASNEMQATNVRVDTDVDGEESMSSAFFHSTQSTTANTSTGESSDFRLNTNFWRSSASEGMIEAVSSSTNATANATTTNKATKSQQNKRCANTEVSSNKTQHKTYSDLSANLMLKQEKSAKEIVANFSKATEAKVGQKQNIASKGTSAVASSSKPSEKIQSDKKHVVGTGTCIKNAIDVDIPMIDLTLEGPFESDSEDGFEVVKVNKMKTQRVAGNRYAQIKEEVKKERSISLNCQTHLKMRRIP